MNITAEIWTKIGSISDIPQRGARRVKYGAVVIAIFRTFDDRIFALEDVCTNCDGPISQGIVGDASVACPICNWEISLETGEAMGADVGQVATYPVRLEGGILQISLSPAAKAA
ncbi:nitrite reductase small subunit NirD [Cohaesibacter celericrescens]|uniref:Nitrite reductase (NAD(P)H) small subunit n=1 Tax=Cohaesibacter celericrescens TaxID=2067669 RepID=A0A2N5XXL2_9HYPH|nr:nitrite reductase small subunit NirD [Cohaesibacter celericrescens]PLW79185.1 nitrite reductase (NAD(P)H) small subunit [Cohaesibacter celericrescens]